jgi:hypothetical protein
MSLNFNKPLEEGKSYQACMDIANFFKIPPVMFDSLVKSPLINAATYAILANTMRLKIGLSMTDSTFGDSIGITPAVVDSLDWQNFWHNRQNGCFFSLKGLRVLALRLFKTYE